MSMHLVRCSTRRAALRGLLARPFSSSSSLHADAPPAYNYDHINSRANDTATKHREFMLKKPLNPHLTNTTSTIANEFPSVGQDKPPADQLTSVDPNYVPKDSVPENTHRMTGGTQTPHPEHGPNAELDVGEIEGGIFKVEPHRRQGEEDDNLRARLLYQSRKRGTLESDLLMSSFADRHLTRMTRAQLEAYDVFLDENDWDIYYWATQQPSPTSTETAEGGDPALATPQVRGTGPGEAADEATAQQDKGVPVQGGTKVREPGKGEWANTLGVFKAAYRPVPARWKNSEILAMLRKHVLERSAGGVHEDDQPGVEGEGLARHQKGTGGGGLGFMPELINVRQNSSGAQ